MDLVGIIIQIILGAIGGYGTGRVAKQVSINPTVDAIVGLIGGVGGTWLAGLVPGLLLALYIYLRVPESAAWRRPAMVRPGRHAAHLGGVIAALGAMMAILIWFGREEGLLYIVAIAVPVLILAAVMTPFIRKYWKLALYAIVLMTGFNFFSHGTQDLYPTFLREQHHFDPATVSVITVILNVGAIIGGLFFASLSQSFGRRRTTASRSISVSCVPR